MKHFQTSISSPLTRITRQSRLAEFHLLGIGTIQIAPQEQDVRS